jgi:uncharacterized protein (DUF2236 family)
MSKADQDSYFAQFALIAQMLGADPVPQTRAEAEALVEALVEAMRPALGADARTKEIARLVLHQKAPAPAAAPVQAMIMEAAVDLLPQWASTQHGFTGTRLTTPVARLSTAMIARTIRWAFAGEIRGAPSQG